MILTLSGAPLSTNHLYKSVCRGHLPTVYLSPEGKATKRGYQLEAKAQWKAKPLEGDIEVWVTFFFGDKRRRDVSNHEKIALDALSGIVYIDDSQIAYLHLERQYDPKRPRIEIEIV